MTSYATLDDVKALYADAVLEAVLPWIRNDQNEEVMDEESITRALEESTEEVNMYLSARYDIPLPSVPRSVRRMTIDIAIYRVSPNLGQRTEEWRKRYEDAIGQLKQIRDGKMGLAFSSGTDSSGGTTSTDGSSADDAAVSTMTTIGGVRA